MACVKSFLEGIFDNEIDQHFQEFTKEETQQYIQKLKEINSNRFRSPYLKALFEALYRGVEKNQIEFAYCTSNKIYAKIQQMTSSTLLPFSGIIAIGPVIQWLYNKLTINTSLEALHILGVFITNKKKLFVFVNNGNENSLSSDKILFILLHELCHMCSNMQPDLFYKLFYDKYILLFYKKYFEMLNTVSKINASNDDIDFFAKEYSTTLLTMEYKKINNPLNKLFQTLYQRNQQLANISFYFLVSVLNNNPQEKHIIHDILYSIYHKCNIKIPQVFHFYQELIFPSEIVCISSFINNKKSEYIEMLNSMFL